MKKIVLALFIIQLLLINVLFIGCFTNKTTVYYCFDLSEEELNAFQDFKNTKEDILLRELSIEQILKFWLHCLKIKDFKTQYHLHCLDNIYLDSGTLFDENTYIETVNDRDKFLLKYFEKTLSLEQYPINEETHALKIYRKDNDPFYFCSLRIVAVSGRLNQNLWILKSITGN